MASKWGVDSKEFNELQGKLEKMEKQFNEFLKTYLIEMAERVINRTKPRTPVDSGDLKRAWILGDIQGNGKNISVEILNGMEYATEVEFGHRIVSNGVEIGWVDGRFMLTTSINEIRQQMPLRYAKNLKEFCHKLGLDK